MALAMPVRPLEDDYAPGALEEQVQERWDEEGAYEATRKALADGEPWYFIDGPPYTSGSIHLGTAWNKIMKDLVLRWRRMQGYRVRDQAGWDMHGLPIEVKVERELGITTKQEIEALGVDSFIEECRGFALGYLDDMTEDFRDLGVWLDWDDPYRTIDDDYIESAWWTVQRAHERDLLYRDTVGGLTWCPRCQTALANAEVEYADRTDPAVYVKFPLADEDAHLVIWTTTSWTLPANNAISVAPDGTYAKVLATKDGVEETLYVHDACVEAVMQVGGYEDHYVLEHLEGRDLEGRRYEHPFADVVAYHRDPPSESNNTVLTGDHVSAEKTGLVHTATGHGEEDYEIGAEHGIEPFCPVDPQGIYNDLAGDLAGTPIDEVHGTVVDHLTEQGLLLAEERYQHSYGHCWRCETPIIYRAAEQFFISITEVKDELLDEVARVDWTPEWAGSARQRDWVEGARDWCVSRQRYWGIPIPVWTCPEGHDTVVGSRDELADLGADVPDDLHRPWIDEATIDCPDCGKQASRVPDILDVWFDSAVSAWAQLAYPAETDGFETWFPCDWIVEGLDQTRGWFYSQLCAGVVALEQVPYDSVLMHGFVHDQQGRPMSKSLGNVTRPSEVIDEHGRDPFRLYAVASSPPWDNLSFAMEGVRDKRRSLDILWNVARFATRYMSLDGYEPKENDLDAARVEDRWLLSRLQGVVADVTDHLEAYELHEAARTLESFVVEEVSRWYVRIVRDRAWVGQDTADKRALYRTLHETLHRLARAFNPFAPHLAERLYQAVGGAEPTVTMADWPTADDDLRDVDLEDRMARAREIVEAALAAREKADLKLRWPVKRVVVSGDEVEGVVDALDELICHQTNAKTVETVDGDWGELELVADPDPGEIGPTFRDRAQAVMDRIDDADAEALREELADGEATLTVDGETVEITDAMVDFELAVPEGLYAAGFEGGVAYVDAERTPDLEREALARELIRRVQQMRKALDLDVEARIEVQVAGPDGYEAVLDGFGHLVAEETRADGVEFVTEPTGDLVETWAIEDDEVDIGVARR